MAHIQFNGLDGFALSLAEVANLPDDIVAEMLTAEAEVVAEATRKEAQKLGVGYDEKNNNARNTTTENTLPGQEKTYSTGLTAKSVAVSKMKRDKKGVRTVSVYFKGKRRRGNQTVSNAEIAFLNEYGTRTINARNFVWRANQGSSEEALKASAEVYDAFLKSKNL